MIFIGFKLTYPLKSDLTKCLPTLDMNASKSKVYARSLNATFSNSFLRHVLSLKSENGFDIMMLKKQANVGIYSVEAE